MDCTNRSLDFVDILTALVSRSTGFINNVRFINLRKRHFIEEVDAYKPVAAFVSWTIGILG